MVTIFKQYSNGKILCVLWTVICSYCLHSNNEFILSNKYLHLKPVQIDTVKNKQ